MKTAQLMKTIIKLSIASILSITVCRCNSSNNENKNLLSQDQPSSLPNQNQNQRLCETGISDSTCRFIKDNQDLFSPKFLIENHQIADLDSMLKILNISKIKFETNYDPEEPDRTELVFDQRRVLYSRGGILSISFDKRNLTRESVYQHFGLIIDEDYFLDGYSFQIESLSNTWVRITFGVENDHS